MTTRASSCLHRFVAVLLGIGLALTPIEIVLRLLKEPATNGRELLLSIPLVPWAPPPPEPANHQGYLQYDATCGWAPRPHGESADGLYAADQWGLRAPDSGDRQLLPAVPCVLIVGDSYAHSDEVAWDGSLTASLAAQLPGVLPLNGAVSGFGVDQALLRFRVLRDTVHPRIAVLAVHPNDFQRNLKMFNADGPWGGAMPWSKPRFVPDGETFRLVNSPPLRGQALRDCFADYEHSAVGRYDTFHVPGTLHARPTDPILTLRFLRSVLAYRTYREWFDLRHLADPADEIHRVTHHIVERFGRDATAAGIVPVVVTLPGRWHLQQYRDGNPWWDHTLSEGSRLGAAHYTDLTPLISAAFEAAHRPLDRGFVNGGTGHYTPETNALVARLLADVLRKLL